jgi:hypothetical protein
MSLRLVRFLSMMSTSITMGAAVAHLLEMPSKMQYEPDLYVRLHRTLYPNFGRFAGLAEAVSLITTGGLAWWLQKRRASAFPLTVAAAGCLAAAHAAFWTLVQPANTTMARWRLEEIPSGWSHWRDQWEYTHAARAVLATGALGASALAVLKETPDRPKLARP